MAMSCFTLYRCVSSCIVLLLFAFLQPQVHAQQTWGDRSFDTSSYSNVDRRWETVAAPGSSGYNRAWQLGVTADNTDTGVIIRDVTPNSAAARAGLFPGDIIVNVAGDQVGRVGNQIYDLGEEINKHTDVNGRVLMLVLDRRRGQLSPINVQLDSQTGGLGGTIIIRGGQLPSDATVTVRLENESRPSYVVRNGEYSFRLANFGVGEIQFEVNYDPRYISPNDTYVVRAFITSGGQTLYTTERPQYVLTKGNPNTAQLVLIPANVYTGTGAGTGGIVQAGYAPASYYQQQIDAAYRRYLGRLPSATELAALDRLPDTGAQVQRLPLDLMATEEFFIRSGGTNQMWVRQVFSEIVGHPPSATETDLWLRRLAELRYSRTEMLNQLSLQARG